MVRKFKVRRPDNTTYWKWETTLRGERPDKSYLIKTVADSLISSLELLRSKVYEKTKRYEQLYMLSKTVTEEIDFNVDIWYVEWKSWEAFQDYIITL